MHATAPPEHAPPSTSTRSGGWAWLRLLGALLGLLITALDAWVTAVLGIRPLIPAVCRAFAVLARECRDRADHVTEADIVTDPNQEVRP